MHIHRFNYLLKLFTAILSIILSLSTITNINGQTIDKTLIEYISPKPGSVDNSAQNNIIIGLGTAIKEGTVLSNDMIKVSGNSSGKINGNILLTNENHTILFKPFNDFIAGEIITVDLSPLCSWLGSLASDNRFSFSVAKQIPGKKYALDMFLSELGMSREEFNKTSEQNKKTIELDSLPANYPKFTIEKYENPSSRKLFISTFGATEYPANLILENNGNTIYYNKLPAAGIDFKKQPDGTLTYFDTQAGKFFALNSKYEIVDSFACGNGFETDLHELLVLTNGYSYLLGMDPRIIDMSQVVPGGDPHAQVIGFLIQELDNNKNVIFQWKSLDYISVTDASDSIDLTAQVIDYIHSNSLCVDFDGNILLSSRHLDEITKIDRLNGDIIWRLGGKENQFTFINENFPFYHQHDVRRIPNGNILFFDNGNFHSPPFSRAVEYKVNEIDHTATLVWQYRHVPGDYFANAMGSTTRLSNGNTLIDWVRAGYITEVTPDGNVVLTIKYPQQVYSYRVPEDDWTTFLYTLSTDTLDFGEVDLGNSKTMNFGINNNADYPVNITSIFHSKNEITINRDFPFSIPAHDKAIVDVTFEPTLLNEILDTLNIRSDTDTTIINSQLIVKGSGTNVSSANENNSQINTFKLYQNYPNPFNPSTKISWQLAKRSFVTVKIFDMLGNRIATLVNKELPAGTYEKNVNFEKISDGYASGIYFYSIRALNKQTGVLFAATKKMIYLK